MIDRHRNDVHRIDRRLFMSELGRRTMAFAVLGPGVLAACSSDGAITLPTTTATSSPDAPSSTTRVLESSTPSTVDDPSTDEAEVDRSLRWERVLLGNVSAYVLARGDEITIVDTGSPGSAPSIEMALASLGTGWECEQCRTDAPPRRSHRWSPHGPRAGSYSDGACRTSGR